MKKLIVILINLLIIFSIFTSCKDIEKDTKHIISSIKGLKRVVTLYDYNGKIIKQWEGKFKIEIDEGIISFITDDGREVKVSGIVIVEEVKR